MVTVDGVTPVVLENADAGIGARYELDDAETVEPLPAVLVVLVVLELVVDEQAARTVPPIATAASASAPRRRVPRTARRCPERMIRMVFPLILSRALRR
jgi:hypothetical protein